MLNIIAEIGHDLQIKFNTEKSAVIRINDLLSVENQPEIFSGYQNYQNQKIFSETEKMNIRLSSPSGLFFANRQDAIHQSNVQDLHKNYSFIRN